MTGYTKLFSSIVHSTIWREADHIRLVWITMLAMKDKDGIIEASLPGLADCARVSIDECKEALEHLMAPDEYSRSPEHDGRRVEAVDGGWILLNHAKYKHKLSGDDLRQKNAERVKRHREKKKPADECNVTCNAGNAMQIQIQKKIQIKKEKSVYSKSFDEFWSVYPKRQAKSDAFKAWQQIHKDPIPDDKYIIDCARQQSNWYTWTADNGKYIPLAASWLRGKRWEDEKPVKPPSKAFKGNSKQYVPPPASYHKKFVDVNETVDKPDMESVSALLDKSGIRRQND